MVQLNWNISSVKYLLVTFMDESHRFIDACKWMNHCKGNTKVKSTY